MTFCFDSLVAGDCYGDTIARQKRLLGEILDMSPAILSMEKLHADSVQQTLHEMETFQKYQFAEITPYEYKKLLLSRYLVFSASFALNICNQYGARLVEIMEEDERKAIAVMLDLSDTPVDCLVIGTRFDKGDWTYWYSTRPAYRTLSAEENQQKGNCMILENQKSWNMTRVPCLRTYFCHFMCEITMK